MFALIAALLGVFYEASLGTSGGKVVSPSPGPMISPPQSGYGQPNPVTGFTPAIIPPQFNSTPGTGPNNPNTLIYSAKQSNTTPNSQISQQGSVTPQQQQQIFQSMQSQQKMTINVGKTGGGPASSLTTTYGGVLVQSRIGRLPL